MLKLIRCKPAFLFTFLQKIKKPVFLVKETGFSLNILKYYFKALTNLVSFDLLLEALFLWITFFFAKRSSIEITLTNNGAASVLLVVPLNFFMAFLVVLAWYLLRKRFAALERILFNDDL